MDINLIAIRISQIFLLLNVIDGVFFAPCSNCGCIFEYLLPMAENAPACTMLIYKAIQCSESPSIFADQ